MSANSIYCFAYNSSLRRIYSNLNFTLKVYLASNNRFRWGENNSVFEHIIIRAAPTFKSTEIEWFLLKHFKSQSPFKTTVPVEYISSV